MNTTLHCVLLRTHSPSIPAFCHPSSETWCAFPKPAPTSQPNGQISTSRSLVESLEILANTLAKNMLCWRTRSAHGGSSYRLVPRLKYLCRVEQRRTPSSTLQSKCLPLRAPLLYSPAAYGSRTTQVSKVYVRRGDTSTIRRLPYHQSVCVCDSAVEQE